MRTCCLRATNIGITIAVPVRCRACSLSYWVSASCAIRSLLGCFADILACDRSLHPNVGEGEADTKQKAVSTACSDITTTLYCFPSSRPSCVILRLIVFFRCWIVLPVAAKLFYRCSQPADHTSDARDDSLCIIARQEHSDATLCVAEPSFSLVRPNDLRIESRKVVVDVALLRLVVFLSGRRVSLSRGLKHPACSYPREVRLNTHSLVHTFP